MTGVQTCALPISAATATGFDPALLQLLLGTTDAAQPASTAPRFPDLVGLADQLSPLPANDAQRPPPVTPLQIARLALLDLQPAPLHEESAAANDDDAPAITAVREALDDATSRHAREMNVEAQVVGGLGLSLTVGLVQWMLRFGALALSFASTLPVWRFFDPLPVLKRGAEKEAHFAAANEDEAPPPAADTPDPEQKVEQLFEPDSRHHA